MQLTIAVTAEEIEKTGTANHQHEQLAARLLPLAARSSSHSKPGHPLWHETHFRSAASGTHGQWFLLPGGMRAHRVELHNLRLPAAAKVLTDFAATDRGPAEQRPAVEGHRGEAARWLANAVPGLLPSDSAPAASPFGSGEQRFTCRLDPVWLPNAVVRIELDRPGQDARVTVAAATLTGFEAMVLVSSYGETLPPLS